MENKQTRIVEIGGVKLEVDLRHAKVIDNYRVGDKVKILVKEYDQYKPFAGIIVGFDDFERLPTIKVAFLSTDSYDPSIKFAYINSKSMEEGKYELTPLGEYDFQISEQDISEYWDRKIHKAEKELKEMKLHRETFFKVFGTVFSDWKNNIEKLTELISR